MKVSVLLSIHNRARLLHAGLRSMVQQTGFSRDEWELLILDDMSTVELAAAYGEFAGRLQIRHIRVDHRRHRIFRELNPGYAGGQEKWWHTPALTINLGIRLARGDVLWITQPEVIQDPGMLQAGYNAAKDGSQFAFADIYHDDGGKARDWFFQAPASTTAWEIRDRHRLRREEVAKYWFSAFCTRARALEIEGVREIYLKGAAAEDDDFRDRLELAGCRPNLIPGSLGVHLYHGDEKEFHHRRDHRHWKAGLDHNRGYYYNWKSDGNRTAAATEQAGNWGELATVDWIREIG